MNMPTTMAAVPKQSRPPKVQKSIRLREQLLAAVEKKAETLGLNFNEGVERALESWTEGSDERRP